MVEAKFAFSALLNIEYAITNIRQDGPDDDGLVLALHLACISMQTSVPLTVALREALGPVENA